MWVSGTCLDAEAGVSVGLIGNWFIGIDLSAGTYPALIDPLIEVSIPK